MTWFPWYTNAGIWVVKLGLPRWIPSLRNIILVLAWSQDLTHIHLLRKTPRIFHDTFETSKTMGSNLTNTEKAEKEPNEFHFSWPICSVKKTAQQNPIWECSCSKWIYSYHHSFSSGTAQLLGFSPVPHPGIPSAGPEVSFCDGALTDNSGLLHLLQRRVGRIVWTLGWFFVGERCGPRPKSHGLVD